MTFKLICATFYKKNSNKISFESHCENPRTPTFSKKLVESECFRLQNYIFTINNVLKINNVVL